MKKNPFLLTILVTIGSIAFTCIFAIVMIFISRIIYTGILGDTSGIVYFPLRNALIVAVFAVTEIGSIAYIFTNMADEKSKAQSKGMVSHSADKIGIIKKAIIILGIVILIAIPVINIGSVTIVNDSGITKKALFVESNYTWDDVYKYKFSCDEGANLSFIVQTNDGVSTEIFNSSNTCTQKFMDKYDGEMLNFAVYLSDKLDSSEKYIGKDIDGKDYMESYFSSNETVWNKIQQILE